MDGDWQKTFTMLTIIVHFVHPVLCVANYLDWVRYQDELGDRRQNLYLAGTIIGMLMYLMIASVFYMWAYRWPLPEEYSQKRRIYGVIVNLIFSDVPMFAIEVDIVWEVGIVSGLQGACFVFTCLSFAYSGIRTWIYLMVTVIKASKPRQTLGGVPVGHTGTISGAAGTAGYAAQTYNYGGDELRNRGDAVPGVGYSPAGVTPGAMGARGATPGAGSVAGMPHPASPIRYDMPSNETPSRGAAGGIIPPSY